MSEPARAELDQLSQVCIHCGLCLEACPTYRVIGSEMDSPRGRIYLMRAVLHGDLQPTATVQKHLDRCVGCRACEPACPSGMQYGRLLEGFRAAVSEPARPLGWRRTVVRSLIRNVLPHRPRLRRALAWGAFARSVVRVFKQRGPLPLGLDSLPRPHTRALLPEIAGTATGRGRVGFLSGCAMSVLFPRVNADTVRVLAAAGYEVVTPPGQGCCGALAAHDGDHEGAVQFARALIAAFPDDLAYIVTNSAGCGAAMKQYGHLLGDEAGARFAAKVRDVSEVLTDASLPLVERKLRVAYYDPCHLKNGQGITKQPRALLQMVPGVELVELGALGCCGGAGTYFLTQPDLSQSLLDALMDRVAEAKPDVVVTGNPSCLLQLRKGTAQRGLAISVQHLAEFLAESLQSPQPSRLH